MYINIVFIGYIAAIFVSLLCLMLIFLVLVRKENRHNQLSAAVRNFAAVVFLTGCLYFIFYYRETVQEQYELGLAFRIVDYIVCCSIYLLWVMVVTEIAGSRKGLKAVGIITAVRLAASFYVTTAHMGPYYNIENPQICSAWNIFEVAGSALTLAFLLIYGYSGMKKAGSRWKKGYVAVGTVMLIFHLIGEVIIDIGLSRGKYGVSAWAMEVPDTTTMVMLVLSLATLAFVFHEDFTPLYFAEALPQKPALTETEKLDLTAMEYQLTTRERELLELLYEGYSNPEIAEKLFISVNTVKKHIKNIYEKLGVNTRVDLVHIVDEQKYPVG